MYSKSLTLVCAAMVCSGAFAQATTPEPTSTLRFNVGAVSDYRFRSIAQSSFKPAVQLGADYAHNSGAYVGISGSSVSWIKDYVGATDGSTEVDLYAGYKRAIAPSLSFDIGVIRYQYPGNTADKVTVDASTTELYGALTYGIVTAKYSQATTNFVADADSKGANYLELSALFDLGNGFALTPHVGRQRVKGVRQVGGDRSGMGKQGQALAGQRQAQGMFGQEAVKSKGYRHGVHSSVCGAASVQRSDAAAHAAIRA